MKRSTPNKKRWSSEPNDLPFIIRFLWTFPHNDHPLPIAEAFDGERWTVDLSYRRTDAGIDLESTATNKDLERARQHAFSNIKRLLP